MLIPMPTFIKGTFKIHVAALAGRSYADPLTRKLRSFRKLPQGWSHGEGIPVAGEAIRVAEEFVNIATRLQIRADVFPGLHGECSVTFYEGDKSVEVIVRPKGGNSFGLHVEKGHGFNYETLVERDDANHAEVVAHIVGLVSNACSSPASSRFARSTQSNAVFQTLYSSIHPASVLAHLTGS
jgi:hypothetical protein